MRNISANDSSDSIYHFGEENLYLKMFSKTKKFGDLREFNLNDAEDKLCSNKEFILEPGQRSVWPDSIYVGPGEFYNLFYRV